MHDLCAVPLRHPDALVLLGDVVNIDCIFLRTDGEVLAVRAVFQHTNRLFAVFSQVHGVQRVRTEDNDATTGQSNRNLRSVGMIRH